MRVLQYTNNKTSLDITTEDYIIYYVKHVYEESYDCVTVQEVTTYHDFPDVYSSSVICKYQTVTDNFTMGNADIARKYSEYLKCDLLCNLFWDRKNFPSNNSHIWQFESFCYQVVVTR